MYRIPSPSTKVQPGGLNARPFHRRHDLAPLTLSSLNFFSTSTLKPYAPPLGVPPFRKFPAFVLYRACMHGNPEFQQPYKTKTKKKKREKVGLQLAQLDPEPLRTDRIFENT